MVQIDEPEKYLYEESLDDLLPDPSIDYTDLGVYDSVQLNLDEPLPPEWDDLARLHKLVRKRKCFTVMEFGLGYSTVVMADALKKNEKEWQEIEERPNVRNRKQFEIVAVDGSQEWINHWQEKIPDSLQDRIHLNYSPVEVGTFNDRMCHYYTQIPDVVPDFIYLDGPHPKQVEGDVNGLSFKCEERTVMSADLLAMEPTLLPGTFVIIDGRTNNARFLERNLRRNFEINEIPSADVTTMELVEDRLGGNKSNQKLGGFEPGTTWRTE